MKDKAIEILKFKRLEDINGVSFSYWNELFNTSLKTFFVQKISKDPKNKINYSN